MSPQYHVVHDPFFTTVHCDETHPPDPDDWRILNENWRSVAVTDVDDLSQLELDDEWLSRAEVLERHHQHVSNPPTLSSARHEKNTRAAPNPALPTPVGEKDCTEVREPMITPPTIPSPATRAEQMHDYEATDPHADDYPVDQASDVDTIDTEDDEYEPNALRRSSRIRRTPARYSD